MKIKVTILSVALLALSACIGCTAQQLSQYTAGANKAQTAVTVAQIATTQAVAAEKEAEIIVAALPDGDAKTKAEAVLATAQKVAAQATQVEAQAQAALDLANQIGKVLNGTNGTVDVSGLSVFGPYGAIAGLLITGGLAVYKTVQSGGLVAKLDSANKAVEDHLTTIASLVAAIPKPTPAPVADVPKTA